MELLTVFLLLLLLVLLFIFRKWPPRSSLGPLPPGPKGFPLVGSFFSIDRHEFLTFVKWSQKYGEVCCFQSGSQLILLLNSYRALKDAFMSNDDAFNGRPNARYLREVLTRNAGVVLHDGPVWQEHRRFMLRVLRDFGFGRTLSEDIITAEWQQLRPQLAAQAGRPVELRSIFVNVVNNVIARLAFGERTGAEDPEFPELTRKVEHFLTRFSFSTFLPVIFPIIMKVKPLLYIVKRLDLARDMFDFGHDFVHRKLEEHRKALTEVGEICNLDLTQAKDLCDALLIERAKREEDGVEHSFTDTQIVRDLLELFVAGTDTTATTLTWAAFYMATNPKVQERVHKEIDAVIGQERCASMRDRLELPYTCAVVDEVLRRSSQVRSGVPHRVMQDTQFYGYAIPKDTIVLFNMYGIHHDPAIWDKPQEFYPEHFLDGNGRYKPSEYLNAFSIGKRACLGENLARMEIFLFFVGFMQSFSMEMADPKADIAMIALGSTGNIRRPLLHEIVLTERD